MKKLKKAFQKKIMKKYYIFMIYILLCSLLSGVVGAYLFIKVLDFGKTEIITPISSIEKSIKPSSKEEAVNILETLEKDITQTVEHISPSIVSIVISKDLVIYRSDPWGFFQQTAGTIEQKIGGGSGFFVKTDGTIITNKHVVADTQAKYTVILNDGTEYEAKILALDPVNDLAIIKIDAPQEFMALPIIEKDDSLKIGSFAIAVGNALAEFQNSVSLGIISGKNRSIEVKKQTLSGLIQTDAAINPGNSGGPLLNLSGEVVGINTAIVSGSQGIGFAISVTQDKLNYMLKSIADSGHIKRPFIGINYIPNSKGIAQKLNLQSSTGVYIIDEEESVIHGSSAEKSGLEPGDIILAINDQALNAKNTLENIIQNSIPGDILKLRVLKKNGKKVSLELTLGEY